MGKPAILRHIESDSGTLSGGGWLAGMPLSNIRTLKSTQKARSTNLVAGNTQWRIDFGTEQTRYFNAFALFSHNGTAAGTVRFVLTNSADDSTTRVYNSGLLPLRVPTIVWGADPWGGFDFDGATYGGGFVSPRATVHLAPSAVTARYLFVYISDSTNPDGYFEVGRFMAGPYWSPEITFDRGAAWQLNDPSPVKRSPAGQRVVGREPQYRSFTGRLGYLNQNDAWGYVLEWQRQGLGRDVLFVLDIDDGPALMQRRTMRCALSALNPIEQPEDDYWSVTISLEELL